MLAVEERERVTEETLGQRLGRLRKERGLQAKQAAGMIGISPQALWNLEHDRSVPSSDTLGHIADAYEVSTDAVLGRTVSRPRVWEVHPDDPEQIEAVAFEIVTYLASLGRIPEDKVDLYVRSTARLLQGLPPESDDVHTD